MSTTTPRRLSAVNLSNSLLVAKPQSGPADQALVRDQYVVLATDQVRPYEDNPRQTANERYDDIKASFKTGGIDSVVLTVTQRPGQKYYICTFGGGTRLKAIKELLAETGDSDRYGQVKCIAQPYRGEQALLAGHIAENTQRGEMTFWDLASAFQVLRQKLEADKRGRVSDRELETRAQDAGLHISRARLNVYTFATTRLDQLACRSRLTFQAVSKIQPRWNVLERLAALANESDEGAIERLAEAFRHALFQFDAELAPSREDFPLPAFLHALDSAAAEALRLPPGDLLHAIDLVKASQTMTWSQLLDTLRGRTPGAAKAAQTRSLPALPTSSSAGAPDHHERRSAATATATSAPVRPPVAAVDTSPPRVISEPTSTPHVNLRSACFEAARVIADELEFGSSVKPLEGFFGYWVEPLETVDPRNPVSQWWPLLAMLSGQFHPDVSMAIPSDSRWARAMAAGHRALAAMPHPAMAWCNVLAGDAPFGRLSYEQTPVSMRPKRHTALGQLVQATVALVAHDPQAFASVSFHLGGAQLRKELP